MSAFQDLVGTWRLLSIQFEMGDTGETVDAWGANPTGWLILTAEGRLMTVATPADRPSPESDADAARVLKNMTCYTGRTRMEGVNRWVTDVEAAWHPDIVGSRQARNFRLEGDRLFIRSDPQTRPAWPNRLVTSVLAWRREA